jgi:DNA-binding transcriptional LysR family regulator
LIDHWFADAGVDMRIAVETSQTAAIRDLVAAGIGSAIVPETLVTAAGPPVRVIRIEDPPIRKSVLAWRADGLPPAAAALVAFARVRLHA